jgi:hypothetical protein
MENGAYLVGIAFWVFVGAVAVAGIIAEHKKQRLGVDLLRTMIEKGQPLDPAMVEQIMSQPARDERTDPVDLKLGGIIVNAAGIGMLPLAFFISKLAPIALYPILGAAALTVCVGVGLLLGAKAVADARLRERLNQTPQ